MSTPVRPALASHAPSLAIIRAATAESEAMVDEATRRSRVRSESYAELIEKHAGLAYVVERVASGSCSVDNRTKSDSWLV
jgi:hypothetical protein